VIVLDTHAWLWWIAAPEHLSRTAATTIADASRVGVSTLSAWEVATLARRGRISLDRDVRLWVRQAFAQPRVVAIAPGQEVAVTAAQLDPETFPGDPLDRLIYATARDADARLVTRDRALRGFDPENTVW
jgi:PIN domain nuclease of toxin-antitoxin system